MIDREERGELVELRCIGILVDSEEKVNLSTIIFWGRSNGLSLRSCTSSFF